MTVSMAASGTMTDLHSQSQRSGAGREVAEEKAKDRAALVQEELLYSTECLGRPYQLLYLSNVRFQDL